METKKTMQELLDDYMAGKIDLPAANEALAGIDCPLRLDPARNLFTAEELMETRTGDTPAEANGYGLMDHGVSCLEKVRVVDGKTPDVNMGAETALVYIGGKCYRLRGDTLTEED